MELLQHVAFAVVVSVGCIAVTAVNKDDRNGAVQDVGCLLQNQFVNEKLASTDEDVLRTKQQGLAEIGVLQKRLHVSTVRHKEYMAHSFNLRRKLRALSASRPDIPLLEVADPAPDQTADSIVDQAPDQAPSLTPASVSETTSTLPSSPSEVAGKSMDELIGTLIDTQSGSEDACHSQLLETKHQLKQLHLLVVDLARGVNSTCGQIMMFNRELQDKLLELSEVSKWRDGELEKCHVQNERAQEMFGKLKGELREMNSIASPRVAMDVADSKLRVVDSVASGTNAQVSLAQIGQGINVHGQHLSMAIDFSGVDHKELGHHLTTVGHNLALSRLDVHSSMKDHPGVQHSSSMQKSHTALDNLSGLLGATHQASKGFQACMESMHTAHVSVAMLTSGAPKKAEAECGFEKEKLQQTYVSAYVELSRMEMEYEQLANSTACSSSVQEQYKNQKATLQDRGDKLTDAINDKTEEVNSLRPRFQSAEASEVKLRDQVKQLEKQCAALGPAISSLDSVRDALHALSDCPGLQKVKFSLPRWTGIWVAFHQDSGTQNDAEQDKLMNLACSSTTEGSRAAEVGEIQEQTVQGIPKSNSAPQPLLGACPDCEGQLDESFQSGHSRVCWNSDTPLTMDSRRNNCGAGKKAVLCVVDQSNV